MFGNLIFRYYLTFRRFRPDLLEYYFNTVPDEDLFKDIKNTIERCGLIAVVDFSNGRIIYLWDGVIVFGKKIQWKFTPNIDKYYILVTYDKFRVQVSFNDIDEYCDVFRNFIKKNENHYRVELALTPQPCQTFINFRQYDFNLSYK